MKSNQLICPTGELLLTKTELKLIGDKMMNTNNKNVPMKQPGQSIGQLLKSKEAQIRMALPKHMDVQRMMRVCMTEVAKNPKLKECEPVSFIGSVILAAQIGLEPGSHLGHGYLIPFNNHKKGIVECQFMPGYRGMIDLARRSGQVTTIVSRAVYEKDQFVFAYGLEDKLEHVPADDDDRGKLIATYAIAKMKGGGYQFEVMRTNEIEKIRMQSKAKNFGPWKTHYDEMAKKTVIRRLFKYLPISVELQKAIIADEQVDAGLDQGTTDFLRDMKEVENEMENATMDASDLNEMAEKESKPVNNAPPIEEENTEDFEKAVDKLPPISEESNPHTIK